MGDIKISKEFETNTSTTYISEDKDVKGLTNNPIDLRSFIMII